MSHQQIPKKSRFIAHTVRFLDIFARFYDFIFLCVLCVYVCMCLVGCFHHSIFTNTYLQVEREEKTKCWTMLHQHSMHFHIRPFFSYSSSIGRRASGGLLNAYHCLLPSIEHQCQMHLCIKILFVAIKFEEVAARLLLVHRFGAQYLFLRTSAIVWHVRALILRSISITSVHPMDIRFGPFLYM